MRQPGERLAEEPLSERYDVSRTPICEALQRLEAEGLVETVGSPRVVMPRSWKPSALTTRRIHLDKSFLGTRWRPHQPQPSLQGRIAAERDALREIDEELPVVDRAVLLARRAVGYGTGFLRSHVDVHPEDRLTRLDAVLEARERLRAEVDGGTLGTFQLRRIARHTVERGLQGRVTVSHAYALGDVDNEELATTAAALAEAGVSILTNGPGATAMPPVLALRAAGVLVCAGTDNIRDAWWPYGSGDMLERADMIGYRQGLFTDDELAIAFDLATHAGAAVLGIDRYGLDPGARANLVAIAAASVPEAVAAPPERLLVLHDGQIVAGTRAESARHSPRHLTIPD